MQQILEAHLSPLLPQILQYRLPNLVNNLDKLQNRFFRLNYKKMLNFNNFMN